MLDDIDILGCDDDECPKPFEGVGVFGSSASMIKWTWINSGWMVDGGCEWRRKVINGGE